MSWTGYLIEKGYKYSKSKEFWHKSIGFGRSIEVEMLVKGLFEIRVGKKTVFSDFILSLKNFKEQINNI